MAQVLHLPTCSPQALPAAAPRPRLLRPPGPACCGPQALPAAPPGPAWGNMVMLPGEAVRSAVHTPAAKPVLGF